MILEAILTAIKYLLYGIIALVPTMPTVTLNALDGVFQVLSVADLFINIVVFGNCLVILIVALNIELIWAVITWVVRKIPGVG